MAKLKYWLTSVGSCYVSKRLVHSCAPQRVGCHDVTCLFVSRGWSIRNSHARGPDCPCCRLHNFLSNSADQRGLRPIRFAAKNSELNAKFPEISLLLGWIQRGHGEVTKSSPPPPSLQPLIPFHCIPVGWGSSRLLLSRRVSVCIVRLAWRAAS